MRYVGAVACAQCHTAIYQRWLATPHARAIETLRQTDAGEQAECVECHATGVGHATGFRPGGVRDQLAGVQCESCHGQGSAHTRLPAARTIRRAVGDDGCRRCHTSEQSPEFGLDPEGYRQRGVHPFDLDTSPSASESLLVRSGARPQVDVFVMSLCPFGAAAEQRLIALRRQLDQGFDLRVRYILRRAGEEAVLPGSSPTDDEACADDGTAESAAYRGFVSLHGGDEVRENLRQLAIARRRPELLFEYLERRAGDLEGDWMEVATALGLDAQALDAVAGEDLKRLEEDAVVARQLGINASPTVFLDGVLVEGGTAGIGRRICADMEGGMPAEVCASLPICTSDADCIEGDTEARCLDPGTPDARCIRQPAPAVTLHVLNDPGCGLCSPALVVRSAMEQFPALRVAGHDVTRGEGRRWIDAFGIRSVPSYVLEGVEASLHFESLQAVLIDGDGGYLLDPASAGRGPFYFERPVKEGDIDLFIHGTGPSTGAMIGAVEEALSQVGSVASVRVRHLLERGEPEDPDAVRLVQRGAVGVLVPESELPHFASKLGAADVAEARRQACIGLLYGEELLVDYVVDRAGAGEVETGDWRQRALALGMRAADVGMCAGSGGADARLERDRLMADSLGVVRPAILVENRLRFDGLGEWNSGAFRRALVSASRN